MAARLIAGRKPKLMQFGLFGSAAARRGGPEFDSSEGFRDFIEYNIEAFVEPPIGFLHRHAKAGELIVAIALADAEVEPAAG